MRYIYLLLAVLLGSLSAQADDLEELLAHLDNIIEKRTEYEEMKIIRINSVKARLNDAKSLAEQYAINMQIYRQYKKFCCDSARVYMKKNMQIAEKSGNQDLLSECYIQYAYLLANTGLFSEAIDCISKVSPPTLSDDLLKEYYISCEFIYMLWNEYSMGDEYSDAYQKKTSEYRDSLLSLVKPGTYEYTRVKSLKDHEKGNNDEAEQLLLNYIPTLQTGSHEYSVLTSILAYVYEETGDIEKRKRYLTLSAISDITGAIKETNSIRTLSQILYEQGELKRANNYVKISMEDASKFNARLRNIQAAQMLPIIDRSYNEELESQQRMRNILLRVSLVLIAVLCGVVIFVIVQRNKLSRARRKLQEANEQLSNLNIELEDINRNQEIINGRLIESSSIKEAYLGRFMELCSIYIDNMEAYRKRLNRFASTGKLDELSKELKSSEYIDAQIEEFHYNFDKSFLSIFPNFISDFNALLPEKCRQVPKEHELLTPELRIFALIRLGINESAKIASFLHYSITTIYTYRSKMKNRSLHPDDFEARVMQIGTFIRLKQQ